MSAISKQASPIRHLSEVSNRRDEDLSRNIKPAPAAKLMTMAKKTTAMSSCKNMMKAPRRQGRLYSWCVFWITVVALGVYLGLWQWERAIDKRVAIEARESAPALVDPVVPPEPGARVTVRGEYLLDQTLYLDNRILAGRLGVAVLTPLRDNHGQLWLIQRGFLETGPSRDPPFATVPEGEVEITGEWQASQTGGPLYGDNVEGVRLQQLSLAPWKSVLGSFSYSGWLHANEGDGVLMPWWEANVMPPSRHLGYAFQWWGLALAALLVMLIGGYRLRSDAQEQS